jgi:hypothetical protein
MILSTFSDIIKMLLFFRMTTYLLFGGHIFNRQSAFLWVPNLFLFSPIYSNEADFLLGLTIQKQV